jgi:hypothetical protein
MLTTLTCVLSHVSIVHIREPSRRFSFPEMFMLVTLAFPQESARILDASGLLTSKLNKPALDGIVARGTLTKALKIRLRVRRMTILVRA